jgi:enediyne biosynthesis protein E4
MATTRTLALCLALFSGATVSSVSRPDREDAVPAVRFENAAAAAGIDFLLRNDATGRKYQVETMLGGVVVIDFDNDGWPDIFANN